MYDNKFGDAIFQGVVALIVVGTLIGVLIGAGLMWFLEWVF
jgi:hypothetical protein